MVTAGEIVTDDRWDGAAVSRRMRLKTGGFAPTPSSTNMTVYEHHQLPIWLYKHQYNHTKIIVANNTDYIHSTNAPPMLILEIKVIHTMIKSTFHFVKMPKIVLCVCFLPIVKNHRMLYILHYTGSHRLGLFCAIHLECSVRCFVLAQPPIQDPAQKHSSMIHLMFNITPPTLPRK